MRLDTECDVTIDAAHPGNEGAAGAIRSLRDSLLGRASGRPRRRGRRRDRGEGLADRGRRGAARRRPLAAPYEIPDLEEVEKWLADNQVLDPEEPEDVFEAMTNGGLLRGLRRRLRERAGRPGTPDAGLSSARPAGATERLAQHLRRGPAHLLEGDVEAGDHEDAEA